MARVCVYVCARAVPLRVSPADERDHRVVLAYITGLSFTAYLLQTASSYGTALVVHLQTQTDYRHTHTFSLQAVFSSERNAFPP